MTSRPGNRPSRFGLWTRLAATVAAAAGATVGAVLVRPAAASASDHSTTAPSPFSPTAAALAEARHLLDDFTAPPGAIRLSGAPPGAPAAAIPPMPHRVLVSAWWRSAEPASTVIAWVDEHPEQGFALYFPDAGNGPKSVPMADFAGRPSADSPLAPDLAVSAYTLADGSTVLRVDATVAYVPARPASELLPAASKLIVVPTFPMGEKQSAPELTLTDHVQISEIAQVVDGLPKAPTGFMSCPMDDGAALALDFENAQNTTLADVVVGVSGCRRVQVSISGYDEPALVDGIEAADRIQQILGTHWDLTQSPD
jgi:hypothetical protein